MNYYKLLHTARNHKSLQIKFSVINITNKNKFLLWDL